MDVELGRSTEVLFMRQSSACTLIFVHIAHQHGCIITKGTLIPSHVTNASRHCLHVLIVGEASTASGPSLLVQLKSWSNVFPLVHTRGERQKSEQPFTELLDCELSAVNTGARVGDHRQDGTH